MLTESDPLALPSLEDIVAAAERLRPHIHRTPVFRSRTLEARVGAPVFLKAENLQRAGAFKIRGAMNAMLARPDIGGNGVVTHSSGNFAQALALAARELGLPAHIVMPADAPRPKVEAVNGYGGQIVFCEPTPQARANTAASLAATTGASFIHPFDDVHVIAGQGTAALELLEERPEIRWLLVPFGGGGLFSGSAIAAGRRAQTVAVEPSGADDAARSLHAGTLQACAVVKTIADGLRTPLCPRTFAALQRHGHAVVTVDDPEIAAAVVFLLERMKLVVEPSGAIGVGPLLTGAWAPPAGESVGVILSGGNVDLKAFFAADLRRPESSKLILSTQ